MALSMLADYCINTMQQRKSLLANINRRRDDGKNTKWKDERFFVFFFFFCWKENKVQTIRKFPLLIILKRKNINRHTVRMWLSHLKTTKKWRNCVYLLYDRHEDRTRYKINLKKELNQKNKRSTLQSHTYTRTSECKKNHTYRIFRFIDL